MPDLPISDAYLYVIVKIGVLALTLLMYWFFSGQHPIYPLL